MIAAGQSAFHGRPFFADRDDRRGLTVDDGGVAAARVIRAIGGHGADLFALGDLVEQFRQDRTVTIAAGSEFHGADVKRASIHGQMHLSPLTTALNTVLARLPLSIPRNLIPFSQPAGSGGHRRVDTGSERRASSADGTGSCSPAPPSLGPPTSAGWQPSRSFAGAAACTGP